MHAKNWPLLGLALLLSSCSGTKSDHSPPPLNKQLLAGKWKNNSEAQFVTHYEFAEDGSMTMTVQGMAQPVAGRYTWTGERTLELEYPAGADVRQAYKSAAKAYKDRLNERVKAGLLLDKAGAGMAAVVRDELPAREKFQASLTEQPRLLLLTDESGTAQTFEKAS